MTAPTYRPRFGRTAYESVCDHVFGHPRYEVGGVLVGRILEERAETIVQAAIPALEATSERANVTFTHDAWATIHAEIERDHPDLEIVGWYHSHPGFGIFLSDHDLFIQRHFFERPGQIAHVVDPVAGSEGIFGWEDGEIVELVQTATERPGLGRASARAEAPPEAQASDGWPDDPTVGTPSVTPATAPVPSPPPPPSTLPAPATMLDAPLRRGARVGSAVAVTRWRTFPVIVALLLSAVLGFACVAVARADAPPSGDRTAPAPATLRPR